MDKIITALGAGGTIIVAYLILVNILALILFGLDKLLSKKEGTRRISESTLMLIAILGGPLGAFIGMRLFRHKTKHKKFVVGVPVILLLEIALAIFLIVKL